MKVVILAGGLPSVIGEENDKLPKPMVMVGERPILWHIMKLFSHYGYNDFIICTGYRSDSIKDYFLNYYVYRSDITVHLRSNKVDIHNRLTEPWQVSIVNTGLKTSTAERLQVVEPMLDEDFIVAYGDCISDINIPELVARHRESEKELTVALARPTGRNMIVPTNGNGDIIPMDNLQKNGDHAWVNACMMVVSPDVLKRQPEKGESFEIGTVQYMTALGKANTYQHEGFWMPVETMRDKIQLQSMWDSGNVVWKVWDD